jgi:hypothetical protein
MTPDVPKSLKYLRALLLIMAVLLALNTLGRLGVVWRYGVFPGNSPVVGAAVLPILTMANIASAFAIIPSEHVGVGLVLDAYLCNGLLTAVLVILLLKRRVRAYFGISRPATRAKAA